MKKTKLDEWMKKHSVVDGNLAFFRETDSVSS